MCARSSSRRSFMKLAAAAPLLSQIAAQNLYAQAATAIGKAPRQNVYSPPGSEDRYQLPWHLDLPQRIARIS